MAEKSVKYNGTHIIQKEMPVVNYIDSEQDNVKYQPSIGQEGSTVATFTNTHHPLESDDVEWKKVELNWTRSATDKYNLLSQNQSNCCENGTTDGFGINGSGTVTISPSTTEHYEGSSSLKVVCDGTSGAQGFGTNTLIDIIPGKAYTVKARVKGSGTVRIALAERDDAGQFVGGGDNTSDPFTLTSSWQEISLTKVITTGTKLRMKIYTSSSQAVTFYVDTIMINIGNPAPWVEGPPSDFYEKVKLYGIMFDGTPELIGEHNSTAMYPTATTESIVFDLAGSAGEPPLINELGSASAGKIRLNLPLSLKEYESVTLKHSPYDPDWQYCKIIPITGSDVVYSYGSLVGPYYLTYVSGMNPDFSDIRFAYWNGTQFQDVNYHIYTQTNSSKATIFMSVPPIAANSVMYLYMFYGSPDATTTSNPNILYYFDNFEDGLLTGRSSPYKNYTTNVGTTVIANSGQISGSYSIKHTGNTNATTIPVQFSETNYSTVIDFDFRLLTQGGGSANDPYISLFYLEYTNSANFIRVDTYWNSSTSLQYIRLLKNVAGTYSTLATYNWTSSKLATNVTHHFKIVSYLAGSTPNVTVYVDGVRAINAVQVGSLYNNLVKGFGCCYTASAEWDNILIQPYYSGAISTSTGKNCTIGTTSAESVNIAPDSWDDTQQYLLFTLPSDYLANIPICFDVDELDSSTYETQDRVASATNVFRLGYDHTAKYHALRVVVETNAESVHNIKWNYVKYDYSVEA